MKVEFDIRFEKIGVSRDRIMFVSVQSSSTYFMNVSQKIYPSFDFDILKKCKKFMLNPPKEEIVIKYNVWIYYDIMLLTDEEKTEILLIHENSLNNDFILYIGLTS